MRTTSRINAANKPLTGGFYTASEVKRLLGISNPNVIHRWLGHGYDKPTLVKQYKDTRDIGFLDLMEIRFVAYFRGQGFSLQLLRKMAAKARVKFVTDHPFALSNVKYKTDKKAIYSEVFTEEREFKLEDILTGQLVFYEVIENLLSKDVVFDPNSGLAQRWLPQPKDNPNVIVDPLVAYGQPSVKQVRMPTKALFANWKAEQYSYAATSDWFEIEEDYVREAVDFEIRLNA